jgi:uncharacterized protein YbjT (DUF2867 family)
MSTFEQPVGPVLLTGATGFVGAHLRPALQTAGFPLRLGSRNPPSDAPPSEAPSASRRSSSLAEWVTLDVEQPETLYAALKGCRAAIYLVHRVAAGRDYPAQERRAALAFAAAAEACGVERIIYLGGVKPRSKKASRHLQSRLQTGDILRGGAVSTFELRAAMIVGHGSLSWRIVRELAGRLPAMVLPRWLGHSSWPVAIDDVVVAVLRALRCDIAQARCYELPGPERVTHRDILQRTARQLGRKPLMMGVPILSPSLSSYWIGWMTSVGLPIARELVHGLLDDLEPDGPSIWQAGGAPTALDAAIAQALADEQLWKKGDPARGRLPREIEQRMAALGQDAGTIDEPT